MSKMREERKQCWDTRDAYYACLDATSPPTITPPKDGEKGPKECSKQRNAFTKNCAKSWIDYFNQRRVLAFEQKDLLAAARKQIDEASR